MVLTKVSIRKPLMMIMVILAVVLFGVVSFTRLLIDLMPEMDFPFVTVQAVYPGAGPEEIETSVVKQIEDQMTTISGLKEITSYCLESVAFILLEFDLGIDADLAAIDVKDKIDAINADLPSDLQKPVIGKFDPNDEPILNLAFSGPAAPEKLRRMADRDIRERLVKIPGVGTIDIVGGREREIHVNLKKEKMDAHGLSIFQVFPVIGAQTANFPAGHVTGRFKEQTVRVQGEFESVDDIAELRIPAMAYGRQPVSYTVPLSEIADIEDAYKEVRERSRFNGREAVGISILKRPDANTVGMADEIMEKVSRINEELPEGFELLVAQDRSDFIRNAVNDSYSSMILGIALTSGILLLFLGDWKLALIAAITMPASVTMALVGMEMMGFTLNIVTLMALSISVGILVANAIVVLENIVRFRDEGMAVREASNVGTSQIAVAVLASALTNLAVFIPIATTGGITGNVFKALGLTIVFATLASLFLAFTLTPLMTSRMLRDRNAGGGERRHAMDRFMNGLRRRYQGALESMLGSGPKMVFAVVLTVVLFGLSLRFVAPRIGMEFFPEGDQGYVLVDIQLPPGTPLHVTDRVVRMVEKRVAGLAEVSTVAAEIGGTGLGKGVETGYVTAKLTPVSERTLSSEQMVEVIRPRLADLPDATVVVRESQMMGGGRQGGDIQIDMTGPDMDRILALTDSVK
jgi:HAE1 family hydrophobic/amphiphilic exporter-1